MPLYTFDLAYVKETTYEVTEAKLGEVGHASQKEIVDEVFGIACEECSIPKSMRRYVKQTIGSHVSGDQRMKTDTYDGLKYRRWGKCRNSRGQWTIVDMLEGPVQLVNKCLKNLAKHSIDAKNAYFNTVEVVRRYRKKNKRGNPPQVDPRV